MKTLAAVAVWIALMSPATAVETMGTVGARPPAASTAVTCDCNKFPWTPNPPCFGKCTDYLSKTKNPDLSGVKNLDPKVAADIKELANRPDRDAINFSAIVNTGDIAKAAMEKKDTMKWQGGPAEKPTIDRSMHIDQQMKSQKGVGAAN